MCKLRPTFPNRRNILVSEEGRDPDKNMKPPLRIAVLECDTPADNTKAKYGSYGGVFKVLLEAGADGLGMPDVISSKKGLNITKYDVENHELYPQLDAIDAILLTGSSMSSSQSLAFFR